MLKSNSLFFIKFKSKERSKSKLMYGNLLLLLTGTIKKININLKMIFLIIFIDNIRIVEGI